MVVIRPEPGCAATVAAARELGLDARGFTLFAVEPVAWEPAEGRFDALLTGSANAFRHGGAGLSALRTLPVLAVGRASAAAAENAGFRVAQTGTGSLQDLLDTLGPEPMRLLRLAGADRIALAPPPHVALVERTVYASVPRSMPAALAALLASPAVVVLHSGVAAAHFAAECDRIGIDRAMISLALLAPRIGDGAGEGWGAVAAAPNPKDAALLALARAMCQEPD
ncbi:MAG: uroporphyrinogen-III synthase [Novosphingobium sp.]